MSLSAFLSQYQDYLLPLTIASVVGFIFSLLLISWVVARIPADYFSHPKRQRQVWRKHSKIVRWIMLLFKNMLGILFILGGVAMLFLPGQGILTILIGIFLLDFPHKYKVEIWILKHPSVLRSINQLRAKVKQPPLKL